MELTYEELMKLALEFYEEGGDCVYECWDEKVFKEDCELCGPMTVERAYGIFKLYKDVWDDIQATIW